MTAITLADLPDHYDAPKDRSVAKALDHVDVHMAKFISLSPFCVLASVAADGTVDASPRGGAPGFVQLADAKTLLMPDRPGNNRLDSYRNLLSGTGEVSLIFFVPGIDETARVAGRAEVLVDLPLRETMVEFGKTPRSVLRIAVREAYLHCAKALMRSRLWDADAQVDRGVLPSMGQMIWDQTNLGPAEDQAQMLARYNETL
jgi:PPOX class probable FMN-dependent enzyme